MALQAASLVSTSFSVAKEVFFILSHYHIFLLSTLFSFSVPFEEKTCTKALGNVFLFFQGTATSLRNTTMFGLSMADALKADFSSPSFSCKVNTVT